MSNFTVNFASGWVWCLLLLIPTVGAALYFHFRTPKKYRRTRNRIISLVLHIVVLVLSVFSLAGLSFSYDKLNTENELLILVDASFSNESNDKSVNDFISTVISKSDKTNKVGVVTFGFDQVYAVPFTSDTGDAYSQYLNARLPDTSATDIAAALNYARGLFSHVASSKIVLISDGIETDGDAATAIRSVAADGIRVDTVYFPNTFDDKELQIIDVVMPDYNIELETSFDIEITVQSSFEGKASVTVYDNETKLSFINAGGNVVQSYPIELIGGVQSFKVSHKFNDRGLHKLRFEVSAQSDTLEQNNTYYAYYYIESFDNILIIARDPNEATNLKALIEEDEYTVTVTDVNDVGEMPKTLSELRVYDEVILVNIANADLPAGFIDVLNMYVHELGGGLFTVGGDKSDAEGKLVPNAYNRTDLYGTVYQDMLPVQAIKYTPPLGLMMIIDHSGSMGGTDTYDGSTRLQAAKDGAISALYGLSERDWVGIMALDDKYTVEQSMVPATQQNLLLNTINSIEIGGGTNYTNAITYAGRALATVTAVEKRHIILVSDGEPGDSIGDFGPVIKSNYEKHGITFSMIVIKTGSIGGKETELRDASEGYGHGYFYHVTNSSEIGSVSDAVRRDLSVPEISEYEAETFTPTIRDHTSVVGGLTQAQWPTLGGFYGTKRKSGAEVPLTGEYVPVYAQWKYGEGRVGSFMCDLKGTEGSWSYEFMNNETGRKFIKKVINALFPSQSIRYRDLKVGLSRDNYTTNISIYTTMEETESIKVTVTGPIKDDGSEPHVRTVERTAKDGFSRIPVVISEPGVCEILVSKLDAQGNILCEYKTFQPFSYSKEYDMFFDLEKSRMLMSDISAISRGNAVVDPLEVFDSFVNKLNIVIDPRMAFIILVIILYLLDIAVRKFKWKWIHELIKEYKAKQRSAGKGKQSAHSSAMVSLDISDEEGA